MEDLPDLIQKQILQLTRLQKNYCNYRAKGNTMAVSAKRAGSVAKDKNGLGRVGYQIEQLDGIKAYIQFLKGQRSKIAAIDGNELMSIIHEIYERAMQGDNLREANRSAELMAKCLGMLTKDNTNLTAKENRELKATAEDKEAIKENIQPFTEEDEDDASDLTTNSRMERLQMMLKTVNNNNE